MDDKTRTEIEAQVFRDLVQHLRTRTDVQNIDLMNLAPTDPISDEWDLCPITQCSPRQCS